MLSLVIVDDLNLVSVTFGPNETEAPLVVDANAVLPLAIATKLLQMVARRHPQVMQGLRVVQHYELAPRGILNAHKTQATPAVEKRVRIFASERSDRRTAVTDSGV